MSNQSRLQRLEAARRGVKLSRAEMVTRLNVVLGNPQIVSPAVYDRIQTILARAQARRDAANKRS